MAQIFAAHDLAVIAGAFRPDTPTANAPSLVWNSSGDHLLQSSKLQSKLSLLLSADGERIQLSSLPRFLDTRQAGWLTASHDAPLIYGKDRQSLATKPEVDRLLSSIIQTAQEQYTELGAFLVQRDVDKDSLKAILEQTPDLELLQDSHTKSSKTWIATQALRSRTTNEIESLLQSSPDDHKTDLSASLPHVPRFLIQSIAEQVSQDKNIKGTIRSGKTRITFLSAAYETMLEDQRAKKTVREFSKILVHTHRYGYHPVPDDTEDALGLREMFFERTKAGLDDGSLSMIHSGDKPTALAFTNQLEVELDQIKMNACSLIEESFKANGDIATNLNTARIDKLIKDNSKEEFAKLVLEDVKYQTIVEQSMQAKLNELEGGDLQRCNEAFNNHVRAPMRLYLAGLNNVKDQALRQRLEDYELEFLSKDAVPTGIQQTQDEKKLRNKALGKELERFGQSCLEAKSLYELQNSLSKFVKKQKLESISIEEEFAIKHRTLQHKLKAMKRMIRGSDILQNLIWILLAQEYEGLFISSGRDTTRMIRFYQVTGDKEVGKKLETWRDRFKVGQETREDFEEMRILAEQTIEQMGKSHTQIDAYE